MHACSGLHRPDIAHRAPSEPSREHSPNPVPSYRERSSRIMALAGVWEAKMEARSDYRSLARTN